MSRQSPDPPLVVRPARDADRLPFAELFAAVTEERDGLATEPPVDVERQASRMKLETTLVATSGDELVGGVWIRPSRFGYADIGMLVAREWRGRGVGSALLNGAIAWAREHELHKLSLEVFPHNEGALALYRKFGFELEGHRRSHIRRQSGELWDVLDMGLLLDT